MAKVGVAIGGVIAFLLFLIVVDLGVNAGRVHYGVSVTGVDLGGKTRVEAIEALRERKGDIEGQVILLTAEGLNLGIQPSQLGWDPNVRATVRDAYDVGREDAPFGALADRVASWLWGSKVPFRGGVNPSKMNRRLAEWDERLTALGTPLDKPALRDLLRDAIAEGRTGPFEFPVRRD